MRGGSPRGSVRAEDVRARCDTLWTAKGGCDGTGRGAPDSRERGQASGRGKDFNKTLVSKGPGGVERNGEKERGQLKNEKYD